MAAVFTESTTLRSRLSRVIAALSVALVALSGPRASSASSGVAPGGSTVYVAPSGSDKNLCIQAAPCLTIDRAYRALAPGGGSVLLASGSYGRQTVARIPAKANDVVRTEIKPQPGASVRLGGLLLRADHVEVTGLITRGYNIYGHDVRFLNVTADDAIYISGATDVSVIGGEVYSPVPVSTDPMISSRNGIAPTNVLLDHVWFHDFMDVGPGNLHHIECLQIGAGLNLTIRGGRFGPNCDTHDVFIRSWGNNTNNSPSPLDIHIESNLFEPCDVGCYALMAYDDLYTLSPTSIEVESNTFEPGTGWSFNWSHGTADAFGNLLPTTSAFNCQYHAVAAALRPNSFFHDNLWFGVTGTGCGTNAPTVPGAKGLWIGNGDYHLAAGSPAVDRFPVGAATDFDGDLRPQGRFDDAGADEQVTRDPIAPTLLTMPGNTIAEATGPAGAWVAYATPTAIDNLDPHPAVTCVPPSGSTFPLGSTTVTCTATDTGGNSSAASFQIAVRDTTAPSAPGSPSVSNVTRTTADLTWTASTDAVGTTGYDLWLDGVPAGSTTGTRFEFGGLLCGTAHTLTVASHDAAGNMSQPSSAYVRTLRCLREVSAERKAAKSRPR